MKWFRLYHDCYRNPKVQDMRPELFKFWINFLCVASESPERGVVQSEAHLKLALGLTKPLTSRYVSELEALSLLRRGDDGTLTPHDWDTLQPDGDDAAKRKRAQRAKTYGNVQSEMSRDNSRDMSGTFPASRACASLEGEGEREVGDACASPTDPPPSLRLPENPVAKRCIEVAYERWGDKDGERVVGDLLKEYEPAWVKAAIDKEWDKHGQNLRPPYLRSILQGFQREGGPPKPKGENNGKTAVQFRPEETVARLKRPDLPRTPEFAGVNRYWDDIEAGRKPNPEDLSA